MANITRRYTLAEFWTLAERENKTQWAYIGSHGPDGGSVGYATANYPASMELARHGWKDGARRVMALSEKLKAAITSEMTAPGLVYDVVGDVPDVGEFMAGTPEHMLAFQEVPTTARVVRVVVGSGARASVSADSMIARGACVCAAIDAIESAGVRCEIVVGKATRFMRAKTEFIWEAYITVKAADEPLNMDRLAYVLAHPSFFRRQLWQAYELENAEALAGMRNDLNSGRYGVTLDCTERGDLYIPAMVKPEDWQSPEAAKAKALAMLEKIGIKTVNGGI